MGILGLIGTFGFKLNDKKVRDNFLKKVRESVQKFEKAKEKFISGNKIKKSVAPDVNFEQSLIDHSEKNPLEKK
ncbi:MAG TPA: hypothetical protein VGQ87_02885 [Patescibacteria group bacterium]|nr:hypothetical protein [Patescibacteria group bacterium]